MVWDACRQEGVISVAVMSDVHAGLQVSDSDLIWAADVVVSADGSAEARKKIPPIFGAKYMHVGEGVALQAKERVPSEEYTYMHDVVVVGAVVVTS